MNWSDYCKLDPNAPDVLTINCIFIVVQNIINAALAFSGVIAVFLIIYSGVKYISSRGNQEAIEGARKTLNFAIIGLIIIMFSFVFLRLIAFFTGLDVEQLTSPPRCKSNEVQDINGNCCEPHRINPNNNTCF